MAGDSLVKDEAEVTWKDGRGTAAMETGTYHLRTEFALSLHRGPILVHDRNNY